MPFLFMWFIHLIDASGRRHISNLHINSEADYVYGYEKTWIYRASGRRHLRNHTQKERSGLCARLWKHVDISCGWNTLSLYPRTYVAKRSMCGVCEGCEGMRSMCTGPLSPTVLPNEKFNYRLCIKKLLYNFPLTKWTMVILILQRCENHTLVYR